LSYGRAISWHSRGHEGRPGPLGRMSKIMSKIRPGDLIALISLRPKRQANSHTPTHRESLLPPGIRRKQPTREKS